MFLELETRDGIWVCINLEQVIMIQGVRTDGSKGYTKIHLKGGAVIATHKTYSRFINEVLQANKRVTVY